MTVQPIPFVDVEAAVRTWGNTLTHLVGKGKPLSLGFYTERPRSPGRGCFARLIAEDGGNGLSAEGTTGWARIVTSVYSATDRDAAKTAAHAWANTLPTIAALRPLAGTVQLIMAADVGWPEWDEDGDEPRYIVRADIHARSI